MEKKLHLNDGTPMQVRVQGTWYIGENSRRRLEEIEALRQGDEVE